MRLLLTWTDREPAAARGARRAAQPGPVARCAQSLGPWDAVWVLAPPEALAAAGALVQALRASTPEVQLRAVACADPSDPGALAQALEAALEGLPRRAELGVFLDLGPAAGSWLALAAAGRLGPAPRLWQVQRDAPRAIGVPVAVPVDEGMRLELGRLRAEARLRESPIIGGSQGITRARRELARLAPLAVPVLLQGPAGSGKDLAARALHLGGPRAEAPLLALGCAAWGEAALRAELLGRPGGGPGLLQQARGGTLVLDGLDALPRGVQAALLQAGVGEDPALPRLVATLRAPLAEALAAGRLQPALAERLAGATVVLPALAERISDLEPLVAHFLGELRRPGLQIHAAAWAALRAAPWPDNVRGLRAEVVRWVALGGSAVEPQDLSPAILRVA